MEAFLAFFEGAQAWLAPILIVMALITTFIGFYKLCRPFREFIQFPAKLTAQLKELDKKVDSHFSETNKRMDVFTDDLQEIKNEIESLKSHQKINDSGTEALLRDRILQAHRFLMGKEFLSQDEYESVTAMFDSYKALGGNHFVDRLMKDIDCKPIQVVKTEAEICLH